MPAPTPHGDLRTGQIVELTIDNVAHGGRFVGRYGAGDGERGRVVFVPDTMPGETVRAQIVDVKKSYAAAVALEVVEASADRVDHIWPEAAIDRKPAERAGGAEFGHIALPRQRQLKQRVIEDALERTGGITREVPVAAAPGDDERGGLGWRTRVRLHVDDRGRQGPFAPRSHEVVPVTDLPLATEGIRRSAQLDQRLPGVTAVDYVEWGEGEVDVIAMEGEPARGRTDTIVETVGDREFQLDRAGFWQVHREAAGVLTDAVRRVIDTGRVDPAGWSLDLYGGVGLFAATIAEALGERTRITSVEADEVATDHASENLAEWIGASAETGRVDRWLRELAKRASASERERLARGLIVLDPPRAGAGRDVVEEVVGLEPAQIVYVACDPVALARDAKLLGERGWEIESLEAFDLFPHTHHIEAVASFRR
ncbi:class I SAM-dependent RNA methyltransferase [Agrococcus carbonis]|uniref:tRNA/tmRNA/rRNA uracil-C5-methylase, TrmA/RlmC/RlmD family n=1 Tax=Agrococcus carbonis TaxID=684552 RepID=A0A1H1M7F7_9MICO|nr:TRAM domain-containing protein [Agrococcus carbonis]SDR82557.1 tRNA/tmRNA/rRNA uracil-C5-methylase, TrmA/RlmC/RlmD family [Agrococcus carbonis]